MSTNSGNSDAALVSNAQATLKELVARTLSQANATHLYLRQVVLESVQMMLQLSVTTEAHELLERSLKLKEQLAKGTQMQMLAYDQLGYLTALVRARQLLDK